MKNFKDFRNVLSGSQFLGKNKLLDEYLSSVLFIKKDMPGIDLFLKMQNVINKDGLDLEINNVKPFLSTTENQRYLDKTLDKGAQSAFIILGSGDTLFELASRGIKDITAAEINELQILIAKLRLASIKTLSARDYEGFLINSTSKKFLSKDVFKTVSEALEDEEAFNIWTNLFEANPNEDIKAHMAKKVEDSFGNLQSLKYGIPYLKRKTSFYKAREVLENADIKIVVGDAIEYLLTHESEHFDYMDITNILLFYYQMKCDNDKRKFLGSLAKLHAIYEKNLNQGGVFTLDYQFGSDVTSFDEALEKSKKEKNIISYKTNQIYKTIFEGLSQFFDLEITTVERVIHGLDKPYDTVIYTRKK